MTPLVGQMMAQPLLVSGILRHAARHHGRQEVISRLADGRIHRCTYSDCERRARRAVKMLAALGVHAGDRVGTLAWNSYRHLELYYAISGSGAVCHTINQRLFIEQIVYIINDAADVCIFFDANLTPLVEKLAPSCPTVQHWVCLCEEAEKPQSSLAFDVYETLMASADEDCQWPEFDENSASSLCYTSGTTGHPKGVLYSHRSTVLHSFAISLPDSLSIDARTVCMPIVPMFHANAWGLPYAVPMCGGRLVLPGHRLDCASIYELLESEQVNAAGCVPTVWVALLDYLNSNGLRLSTLRRAAIGGSAVPYTMIKALAAHDIDVRQAWGMTETSPLATTNALLHKHATLATDDRHRIQATQGRAVFGIDLKICGEDGEELPWNSAAMGQIFVRGPWVASGYYKRGDSRRDGWFPTGDIASIDPDGYVEIRDRAKDLIKSGGEWISSVEIEGIAMAHPAVQQAACIAMAHPKWVERPLLVVVLKSGQQLAREELLEFFAAKLAKWARPSDAVFVDALPLTATGKINKLKLRADFAGHRWPD